MTNGLPQITLKEPDSLLQFLVNQETDILDAPVQNETGFANVGNLLSVPTNDQTGSESSFGSDGVEGDDTVDTLREEQSFIGGSLRRGGQALSEIVAGIPRGLQTSSDFLTGVGETIQRSVFGDEFVEGSRRVREQVTNPEIIEAETEKLQKIITEATKKKLNVKPLPEDTSTKLKIADAIITGVPQIAAAIGGGPGTITSLAIGRVGLKQKDFDDIEKQTGKTIDKDTRTKLAVSSGISQAVQDIIFNRIGGKAIAPTVKEKFTLALLTGTKGGGIASADALNNIVIDAGAKIAAEDAKELSRQVAIIKEEIGKRFDEIAIAGATGGVVTGGIKTVLTKRLKNEPEVKLKQLPAPKEEFVSSRISGTKKQKPSSEAIKQRQEQQIAAEQKRERVGRITDDVKIVDAKIRESKPRKPRTESQEPETADIVKPEDLPVGIRKLSEEKPAKQLKSGQPESRPRLKSKFSEQQRSDTFQKFESTELPDRPVTRIKIDKVDTDLDRFQGRRTPFKKQTVNALVKKGDVSDVQPIVLFRERGRNFVLSGHSRLEAFKRRGESRIQAQFFKGTSADAIKFAKSSNLGRPAQKRAKAATKLDRSIPSKGETIITKPVAESVVDIPKKGRQAPTAKVFKAAKRRFDKFLEESKKGDRTQTQATIKRRLQDDGFNETVIKQLVEPERTPITGKKLSKNARINAARKAPENIKRKVESSRFVNRLRKLNETEQRLENLQKQLIDQIGTEVKGSPKPRVDVQTGDAQFASIGIEKITGLSEKAKNLITKAKENALATIDNETKSLSAFESIGRGFEIVKLVKNQDTPAAQKRSIEQNLADFINLQKQRDALKQDIDTVLTSKTEGVQSIEDDLVDAFLQRLDTAGEKLGAVKLADDVAVVVQRQRTAFPSKPILPETERVKTELALASQEVKGGIKLLEEHIKTATGTQKTKLQKDLDSLRQEGDEYLRKRRIKAKRAGYKFFDIRENLSKTDQVEWDLINGRLADIIAGRAGGQGIFDPNYWIDSVAQGRLVIKSLSKQLGGIGKVTFEKFKEALKSGWPREIFRAVEENLRRMYNSIVKKETFKPPKKPVDREFTETRSDGDVSSTQVNSKSDAPYLKESKYGSPEFLKFVFTDLLDKVAIQNKTGSGFANQLRKAIDDIADNRALFAARIDRIEKVLQNPIKRRQKLKNIEQLVKAESNSKAAYSALRKWLYDGDVPWSRLTSEERQIVELIQNIKNRASREFQRLGIKSSQMDIFGNPSDTRPPVAFNSVARQVLFKDKQGPLYKGILQAIEAENPNLKSPGHTKLINIIENKQFGKIARMPDHVWVPRRKRIHSIGRKVGINIREGEYVPIMANDAMGMLNATNFETARMLAIINRLGNDFDEVAKTKLNEFIDGSGQAEGRRIDFEDLWDSYWGLVGNRSEVTKTFSSSRNVAVRAIKGIGLNLKSAALTLSAPIQLLQPMLSSRNVGFRLYAQAVKQAWSRGRADQLASLEALGVVERERINTAFKKESWIEDASRISSQAITRLTGLPQVVLQNDLTSSLAYREWARGFIRQASAGTKLSTRDRQSLESLRFTKDQIDTIEQGRIREPKKGEAASADDEKLFSAIINRGRKSDQFTGILGPEKSKFLNTPLGQVWFPFQTFSVKMTKLVADDIAAMMDNIGQDIKDSRQQGKFVVSPETIAASKRLAVFMGAATVNGEFSHFVRHIIRGHDLEEALRLNLPENEERNWLEATIARVADDLFEGGFLGPAKRWLEGHDIYGFGVEGFAKQFFPTSVLSEIGAIISHSGKYSNVPKWEGFGMFLENRVPALKGYPRAAKRWIAWAGYENLVNTNELKLDGAIRSFRKWQKENVPDKGRRSFAGFKDSSAAFKKAFKMWRRDENTIDVQLKLAEGFGFKKTELLEEGRTDKLSQTALNSLKSSIRNRKVLKGLSQVQKLKLARSLGLEKFKVLENHDILLEQLIKTMTISRLETLNELKKLKESK